MCILTHGTNLYLAPQESYYLYYANLCNTLLPVVNQIFEHQEISQYNIEPGLVTELVDDSFSFQNLFTS